MDLIQYTKQFAESKESEKSQNQPTKRIGTLCVSIPTRKFKINKRGVKRRLAMKFEAPLMGGSAGALTPKSAMVNFGKDLQGMQKITLNPKRYRKIVEAFMTKN